MQGHPIIYWVHDNMEAVQTMEEITGKVTVFMLMEERNSQQVGTYSISGQPAFQEYIDVCLVYWPQKKVAGKASVLSQMPPEKRRVQAKPEYGDILDSIKKWMASLPKTN